MIVIVQTINVLRARGRVKERNCSKYHNLSSITTLFYTIHNHTFGQFIIRTIYHHLSLIWVYQLH